MQALDAEWNCMHSIIRQFIIEDFAPVCNSKSKFTMVESGLMLEFGAV
jgi:hypothetical protein